VIDNYESGESVEEIAFNFDLKPEDVRKLLAYASAREFATQAS
jgi:uncharacterized protein (DUF433 family)